MANEDKIQKCVGRPIRIIIKGPKPPSPDVARPIRIIIKGPKPPPSDILGESANMDIKPRSRPAAEDEGRNPNKLAKITSANVESESSPRILSAFASLLHSFVARHERLLISSGEKITRENLCVFSAMQVQLPSLEKMFKNFQCCPSVFVVAYVYIDRLILKDPNFRLTSHNIHRLAITSVMISVKFLGDLHYSNEYFAKMGGLTLKEMNNLEVKFLSMLEFRLQVTVSVFEIYCSRFKVESGGGFQIGGFEKEIDLKDEVEKGRAARNKTKKGRDTKKASDNRTVRLDRIFCKLKKQNRKKRSTYQNTMRFV